MKQNSLQGEKLQAGQPQVTLQEQKDHYVSIQYHKLEPNSNHDNISLRAWTLFQGEAPRPRFVRGRQGKSGLRPGQRCKELGHPKNSLSKH